MTSDSSLEEKNLEEADIEKQVQDEEQVQRLDRIRTIESDILDPQISRKSKAFRESDAGDGTTREDQILTGTPYYICVVSLILCMFLIALDQMITAAILTTVSDHFHDFGKMTWITAAYMMPMGCCAQVWGRLSISFGRKWIMVICIIIFELGSLVAGVSNSMDMFIGGRALQGVGASGIQSIVMIIGTEITTMDRKPILLANLSLTFVVASCIGPIIGGLFGTYVSWRWCFYINLCCGALIFPFFVFTYKPKPPVGSFMDKLRTVDFLDSGLMIASIVLILLALSFGQNGTTWRSSSVISCFVIGGVLLIIFGIYNFGYSKFPAIPRDIVSVVKIDIGFIVFSMNYAAFLVMAQFLSIYYQNVAGHNAFHTGLSLIPMAIATSGIAIVNGIVMKKFGIIKEVCLVGAVFLPVAIGLLTMLGTKENLGWSIGFQILLGSATGMNFQGPLMSALIIAPKTPGSSILTTAFFNFGRSVASALFSEIAGAIYTATLKAGIKQISSQIQEKTYPLEAIIMNIDLLKDLNIHDRGLVEAKILSSIDNTFYLALAMALVSFAFTFFLSGKKVPKNVEA
ncbi:DEKNAAC101803 [Brettanomyces naardenensis]|uniref:DEKNAAC101803 n=1 Tax=Brettanomyces naardenensis TaxID=13370 RepID=A0A448YJB6_BRENA|nr:DEKNAAC101803 [Brettanomyces naardenensis]